MPFGKIGKGIGWEKPLPELLNQPVPHWGQGISRPIKGEKTRLYKLVVRGRGVGEMKVRLRAPNREEAIKYAQNRWPETEVSRT